MAYYLDKSAEEAEIEKEEGGEEDLGLLDDGEGAGVDALERDEAEHVHREVHAGGHRHLRRVGDEPLQAVGERPLRRLRRLLRDAPKHGDAKRRRLRPSEGRERPELRS